MSSPFAHRLETNYFPDDEEVLEIQGLLVEPTLRLKRLDDEIADLQKAIDKLAEERNSLGAYVAAHKALISPVRRLPLDIIQEIFIACLPTHRYCVMSASEAPILLGRICSAWRAISFSTPQLWARLHIVEPSAPYNSTDEALLEQKATQRLEITKTWLDRSGQCPLSISLQCAPYKNSTTPSASTQFLKALIPFAPRWQHLQLATPPSILIETMSHFEFDAPILETIVFPHEMGPFEDIEWGSFAMLHGARISSFSIPAILFIPERLPLRWNQLTTLSVGGPVNVNLSSERTLQVLSWCPELRCCRLTVYDESHEIRWQPRPMVELPFLNTFDLHCSRFLAPPILLLLERLSLPELRNFTFFADGPAAHNPLGDPPPSLTGFLARSTGLESLNIGSNIFSKSSFLQNLLALPPTIQRLGIHDMSNAWGQRDPWAQPTYSLDDDTLSVLTPAPGLNAFSCPALQHLSIFMQTEHFYDYTRAQGISDEALLQFITARIRHSPATLTHVHVQFERQMTLDILPSLEPFIEAGLDVSLTYVRPSPLQISPWQGLAEGPPPLSWGPPPQPGLW